MFKHVLTATDGQSCSRAALRDAMHLALAGDAKLTICHVIDFTKVAASLTDVGSTAPWLDALESAGKELLQAAIYQVKEAGINADARMVHGAAVSSINELAREIAADVIVVGSHGREGVSRLVLGSVAEGVLRTSSVPVIVRRERPELEHLSESKNPYRNILVAYDGSPHSGEALNVARTLVESMHGTLSVCFVVDFTSLMKIAGTAYFAADSTIDALRAEGQATLDRVAIPVADKPPNTYLLSGSPVDEILACAKETGADLIVMGSHGRSGVMRALLGSVAESVTRHSPVPVMVVRIHVHELQDADIAATGSNV